MFIDSEVRVGDGNQFSPGVVVRGKVSIGNGNWFGPGTIIDARQFEFLNGGQRCEIIIGDGNFIGAGVSVGSPSRQRFIGQHQTLPVNSNAEIRIGNGCIFHEYVTIHAPVQSHTDIADLVVIGAHSHLSHDCRIEKGVVTAAGCLLGGYVRVGCNTNLGLGANIHPRTVIGGLSMVGAGSTVLKHVPPGARVAGIPARVLGSNELGISRRYPEQNALPEQFLTAMIDSSVLTGEIVQQYWEWFTGELHVGPTRRPDAILTVTD